MLHNRRDKETLQKLLEQEGFSRTTISFYRYVRLDNVESLRDELYEKWNELGCLGRIYLSQEGVNAQMSIPEHNMTAFRECIDEYQAFRDVPFKIAVEDDGKSFLKLTIKVKNKIVADGLADDAYDVTNVGNHLSPMEFHAAMDDENTVVVDMRNHYETEVGYFENAYCPDVDTFREAIVDVEKNLEDKKDKKLLLYCTGGIRCEKASAYLKSKGFEDVHQLHGGIIAYAQEIKSKGEKSKYIGKNFVFDERMGESIDGQVIAHCHQCGTSCDDHVNCANDACHLLFIQCPDCEVKYEGCCSEECTKVLAMSPEELRAYRQEVSKKVGEEKLFSKRLRPKNLGQVIH